MPKIVIPYKAREIFLPYHASQKRFSITVAHRRAGKSVARINKLIKAAVTAEKLNPRFGYLSPFYVQSKDIAWAYLKHYCQPLIEIGAKVNESELSIALPHNNALIKLYGAENAHRMRGLYFDGIVIDEAQHIARHVLTEIILPSLADRQGWLDVSGTPQGWENLLGELYKMAKAEPDKWHLDYLKASETGILPQEELAQMRRLMTEEEYAQEFECSFDVALRGAIYGKEISHAQADGRITRVPYNPSAGVYTAWDLGYGDSTAIWFCQLIGKEPHVIDYYEANGAGLDHYAGIIKSKPYNYTRHFLPHDAGHGSLRTGKTLVQQLNDMGIANTQVLGRDAIEPGIQQGRQLLETAWFDEEKCKRGLDALRNYQRKWDEQRRVFSINPLHNWASNGSDSWRYLAIALASLKSTVAILKEPGYYAQQAGYF